MNTQGATEARPQPLTRAVVRPVATVLSWELQRIRASRFGGPLAGLMFVFFLLLAASQLQTHDLNYGLGGHNIHVVISGTSLWAMSITIPRLLLLACGLFIPFITADQVSRDWKRRMHEILMATCVPGWAYALGRYLVAVLVTLLAAALVLLAVLVLGVLAMILLGNPPMNMPAVGVLWSVMVLPAVLLLSGVSFALGTLLPRHANLVKTAVLIAWFLCASFMAFPHEAPAAEFAWDPTSTQMSAEIDSQYTQQWLADFHWDAAGPAPALAAREVEQRMPDLWPWVGPHLGYACLGVAVALLATVCFRRFRNI